MGAPQKGVAFTFDIGLVEQANRPQFKSNPTLATGDFKVSKDGGAYANLTTLPTVVSSGKVVRVALSSTEMNADTVTVVGSDASGSEWDDVIVSLNPTVYTVDGCNVAAVSGDTAVADSLEAMLDGTGGVTLSLAQINVVATGNNSAIVASGAGTGHGIAATGGATGHGANLIGGATSGNGLRAAGTAGNSAAANLVGQGSAAGMLSTGGATGEGLRLVGGATSGPGLAATAGAANSAGVTFTGLGTSAGLQATGGATGHGINATGGSTSGSGINASATSGAGINSTGGTNGAGVSFAGAGTGAGISMQAGATGHGLSIVGGGTSGDGVNITTTAGDGIDMAGAGGGAGLRIAGSTSAAGVVITAGATGHGISIAGGSTSGDGINITATSGDGIDAAGGGAGVGIKATGGATGHGLTATGGSTSGDGARFVAATSGDGLELVGAGGGLDLNGDISLSATESLITTTGTAQAGASCQITLAAGASSTNDLYNGQTIYISSGTGAGQVRVIRDYTGSTKVALVDYDWATTPDNTSVYVIRGIAANKRNDAIEALTRATARESDVIHYGTAQAGASTTITLQASGSSSVNDFYVGCLITLYDGTGVGQARIITDYNGTTKVATIDRAWSTNPDNTTLYAVRYTDLPSLNSTLGVATTDSSITISGSINDAGPTAAGFIAAAGLSASDDFYNGAYLIFTSGVNQGIGRPVTDYAGATRTFTFSTVFPAAPSNGDTFVIGGRAT